jgi:EmrB/QacA subfamily drug resistance transporter
MTTMTDDVARRPARAARRGHHPGIALGVIAASQLMVVLDATIVNIALPNIQRDLEFSSTGLAWVLNAYTLTFGGLLLLGGRMGDILGRRRVFIVGIALFTLASFLGGLATTEWWLLASRALQGVGGALASPTALALIATNFEEGAERNRAFGVFAAVSGSGAAIGLLAGGMLTSWLSWRWVLFVNVPIGIVIALLAPMFVNESERRVGRFDFTGALTSTLGMTALVYGFIRAAQEGWRDGVTVASFAAAGILLIAFFVVERRTAEPITPLHLFGERNRAGTYLVMLSLAAALFSMFFFLTQFVQEILGYSPLKAGFAFLPVSAVIVITAQIASRRLLTVGPKPFMVAGAVLATVGLAWQAQIDTTSSYAGGILGPMILFAAGMGFLFVPLTITAVNGVEPRDSGAASSLLNVMQQVGGSLGLSILVTVFGTAIGNEAKVQVARFLAQATPQQREAFAASKQLPRNSPFAHEVLAHGISTAFQVGVLFSVLALLVAVFVVRTRKGEVDTAAIPGMAGS